MTNDEAREHLIQLLIRDRQIADPRKAILTAEEATAIGVAIGLLKNTGESYTPIGDLGLSSRTRNKLLKSGISSIEELCKCADVDLRLSTTATDQIREALEKKNLKLRGE